ncbi:MAG: quinone-dependent dihydroorotate dehydrogenase [Burkholderiaceae bacterium]|jgi:dihydroorotate dehydrogenase|nr:quinone-dependent dihydroorotate dehydrogenase [Burkholderiaceae bacterium]
MLYELARPLIFRFSPETAHDLAFHNLARAHKLGLTRVLRPAVADDPVDLMGLRFPNPVGLAAGLDKNGEFIDAIGDFGFGFIEAGTVTPRPQPGNPQPRVFRLPAAQGLINRMGFNNLGLDAFVRNVAASAQFSARGGILGLNIGKNADTPIERALDDYLLGLRAVYPLLVARPGYVAVNISSPNTKNLRSLQGGSELAQLLAGLRDERARLADTHGRRVPIAVKIAPDLTDDELPRVADTLVAHGIDAVIATNTTLSREGVAGLPNAQETGGLSGAPLRARATQVIALLSARLRGRLPILGVGGIHSGDDAVEKIQAGAALVQIYTGLIYRGPALVGECRRAITAARARASAPSARRAQRA